VRYVSYSNDEKNIVESGIAAIQEVLMGTDDDAKASLLFCLDKYLDPYFGYNLPYKDEIYDLLETVVVSPNTVDIREDALNLLIGYAGGPFPILEKHFESLPEALKSDALYAINMYAMWSVEKLVLKECVRLFQENEASNNSQSMGEFPKSAIVVFNTEGNADGEGYDNWDFIEEIWKIEKGEYKAIGVPKEGIPRVHSPLSKAFYPVGEFYFNMNLREKEVYLSYIFGPRYGRGFKYEIQMNEETREARALVNQQVLWAI